MALFAKDRAAHLWLERYLIMLAAVVANDLKSFRCVLGDGCLFRTAFGASLRRHHIALIKHLLVFFSKREDVPALNTRDFYVWHISLS